MPSFNTAPSLCCCAKTAFLFYFLFIRSDQGHHKDIVNASGNIAALLSDKFFPFAVNSIWKKQVRPEDTVIMIINVRFAVIAVGLKALRRGWYQRGLAEDCAGYSSGFFFFNLTWVGLQLTVIFIID